MSWLGLHVLSWSANCGCLSLVSPQQTDSYLFKSSWMSSSLYFAWVKEITLKVQKYFFKSDKKKKGNFYTYNLVTCAYLQSTQQSRVSLVIFLSSISLTQMFYTFKRFHQSYRKRREAEKAFLLFALECISECLCVPMGLDCCSLAGWVVSRC